MRKKEKSEIGKIKKIAPENYLKFAINLVVLFYTGFSLLSLQGCSKKNDQMSFEQQVKIRNSAVAFFKNKYGAEEFDCNSWGNLDNVTILDTVILGIRKQGGNFTIKSRINASCNKKYYAELKCSEEIAEQFDKTKSSYAVLAVKISNIFDYNLIAESDTLDGTSSNMNLGNSVLLTGECLAFAEVPAIVNAN